MHLDIGLAGIGLLAVISLVFGALAHLVVRSGTGWMWLIASAGWFVGGLFASEVVWGTMTADEIQPIIDGLAFDEALLGGLILGVVVVIVARLLAGPAREARPTTF